MKKLIRLVLTLSAGVVLSFPANAACRKSYVCDDYGRNCRYQDVCDNAMDLPSIGLNPLPPLPTMELKPLPSMQLPPLGTTNCRQMMVNGQWQNICQ